MRFRDIVKNQLLAFGFCQLSDYILVGFELTNNINLREWYLMALKRVFEWAIKNKVNFCHGVLTDTFKKSLLAKRKECIEFCKANQNINESEVGAFNQLLETITKS